MSERNLHQDMTEAERRISNVALMGQVVALDTVRARVRVQAGPITTGWLPFATLRAGPDRTWHPPEPGEQVLLVAPGGDLNQGVVVGSIYRADHPAPADSEDISRTLFKDGAVMEYDRAQHHWRLAVPVGGKIVLEIGATKLELSDQGARLTAPRIDLN
jgi:phage baseplate assembly protein V